MFSNSLESKSKRVGWLHPMKCAEQLLKRCDGSDFVFLFSAKKTFYSGRFSYIGFDSRKRILDFGTWRERYQEGIWMGYLGYESLSSYSGLEDTLNTYPIYMASFDKIMVFDHDHNTCDLICADDQEAKQLCKNMQMWESQCSHTDNISPIRAQSVHSNMTTTRYKECVSKTIEAIKLGEFYQANITRKIYGDLEHEPSIMQSFKLFRDLCKLNPNPYSGFLKLGKLTIISASPEMFLKVTPDGLAETNPIKGTSITHKDPKKDALSKEWLQNSKKNYSENLMIVDLKRNDLARGCQPGSIKVPNFYKICSYTNVHHAISTITGKREIKTSILDFISNCFPPGSITGTPKKRVIEWCREIEKMKRGIYSGSIGWFNGKNNTMDCSVVIRTLILAKNNWEFQAGGAILAQSDPDEELEELVAKISPICKVLGINTEIILNL